MRPWAELWGWYNQALFKGKGKGKGTKKFEIEKQDGDSQRRGEEEEWWGKRIWEDAGIFSGATTTTTTTKVRRAERKPQVVVYGHDARTGLQLRRWSKGLDSGCVGGGRLTALVLDARGRQEVFGVGCRDRLR